MARRDWLQRARRELRESAPWRRCIICDESFHRLNGTDLDHGSLSQRTCAECRNPDTALVRNTRACHARGLPTPPDGHYHLLLVGPR